MNNTKEQTSDDLTKNVKVLDERVVATIDAKLGKGPDCHHCDCKVKCERYA